MVCVMTIWPPRPEMLGRPAYRSLAQIISAAIAAGELQPGDRLPTHRDLAFRLGVSVQTVSRAYDALIRADVISGEVGRGTFVKSVQAEGRAPPYHRLDRNEPVIDCSMLTPVIGDLHARAMDKVLVEMAGALPSEVLYSFRPRLSMQRHAEWGADWLVNCGLRVRPHHVLLTNGNTPAMSVALMTAASAGDLIMSEARSHHTLKGLARYLGLRLAAVPCDEEGVLPDAFEHACSKQNARILYVMPSGNGPMAGVMGPARRIALAEIARSHNVTIVENDAWGPLEPGRPRPSPRWRLSGHITLPGFRNRCCLGCASPIWSCPRIRSPRPSGGIWSPTGWQPRWWQRSRRAGSRMAPRTACCSGSAGCWRGATGWQNTCFPALRFVAAPMACIAGFRCPRAGASRLSSVLHVSAVLQSRPVVPLTSDRSPGLISVCGSASVRPPRRHWRRHCRRSRGSRAVDRNRTS
jgi:DNA-binding transcriptional regulator YhcF (GntR family)